MVTAKKFGLANTFKDEPQPSDLKVVEEELPALKYGEFLIQAEYLSVDPYMRPYVVGYPLGVTMIGSQIAKIIDSKNSNFPVGERVLANVGWRSHTVINETFGGHFNHPPYLLPDFGDLPASLGLDALGMPGNTAYFGFVDICQSKSGEILVVSGAAGAVGSHVGQIGKILGLKVIGMAGSDKKCRWLIEELGLDCAINYKTQNVAAALKEAAPHKVDCYFDNVCEEISSIVINHMNIFGRVPVCGSISSYNLDINKLPRASILQPALVFNQ